jgi:hypothetical protein
MIYGGAMALMQDDIKEFLHTLALVRWGNPLWPGIQKEFLVLVGDLMYVSHGLERHCSS